MQMTRGREKSDEALLSLAEVLSISGITKLVLHAWERRYGIEPAQRSETGRRFYTADQAEWLRLLKVCSDAGHRIGGLIALPLDDLRRIENEQTAKRINGPLIQALQALEGDRFRSLLQARADAEGPETFIDATVMPLLRDIGALWADGSLSIAAEHMATAKIKRALGGMIDQCPPLPDTARRMITATPSGEEHEIGALATALIARLHGFNSLFLGPDLPLKEIAAAALARQVDYVCLSALIGKPRPLQSGLRLLREALPEGVVVITGGPGYAAVPEVDGVIYVPHFDAFRSLIDGAV